MNLTKLAIKRPVAIFVSIVALFVFGAGSILSTPMELIPSMELPMMIVYTAYPGAGPDEVESLVTTKVESAVATLSGLKNVQSTSSENSSMVMIEMEYGTNSDRTRTDLQKNLDMIKNSLPDSTIDPIIFEMSTDSIPVIVLSASATSDIDLLNYVNDNIIPEFEKLEGVAQVQVSGGRETYVQIQVLPERLRQYKLDMATIGSYIKAADFSIPVGYAEQGDVSMNVRGGVSYKTVDELRRIPITLPTGDVIQLSEVANVQLSQKDASSISRYNGQETVSISITKRASAGTTNVSDDVRAAMEQINTQNKNFQLEVIMDTAGDIRASLWSVAQAMIAALIISMFVLYFFLGDVKASFVIGTSIPISLFTTLIIMSFTGMSFNMLSLGGLTIGVGMMVDNSIVVLDSCFKERLGRRTFREAALEGARIVTSAVVASTITTIVVFLPICLMEGLSGQMFSDVGLTIVYALTASLVSAIMLVPLLFVRLKPVERKGIFADRMLERVGRSYERLLRGSFKHRKLVVLFSIVLLAGSIALIPLIGMELMPATDAGQISITVQVKPSTQLSKVDGIMQEIEAIVVAQPDFDRYSMTAGSSGMSMGGSDPSITVYLKTDRKTPTADVADAIREATKNMRDCKVTVQSTSGVSMGSTGGSDMLSFRLMGRDREALTANAERLQAMLRTQNGVLDASTSLSKSQPQFEVHIDPVKAGAAGLVPAQAVQTVNTLLSGTNATTIRFDTHDYEIRVEYPDETYNSLSDVQGILLDAPGGRQVALSDIATFEYTESPQQIDRYNSQYVLSVTAQLQPQNAAKLSGDISAAVQSFSFSDGVELSSAGTSEQMNSEFAALLGALGTAIFLVFLVMAIQFESIRFSLMVMFSMPFSLIGAMGGLLLTNTSISMPSLLGIIMLMGIVVNNAIVLIDYTNQLRNEGVEVHEALVESGISRMRPILMTTLTTVLGMVPLAIGTGENGELMRGMAMVIIGGLTASTLLTLVLIPTFYLMITKKERHKADRSKRTEDEDEVLIPRAENDYSGSHTE